MGLKTFMASINRTVSPAETVSPTRQKRGFRIGLGVNDPYHGRLDDARMVGRVFFRRSFGGAWRGGGKSDGPGRGDDLFANPDVPVFRAEFDFAQARFVQKFGELANQVRIDRGGFVGLAHGVGFNLPRI